MIGIIPTILFKHFDDCPAIYVCINTHRIRICQIHISINGQQWYEYGRAISCGLHGTGSFSINETLELIYSNTRILERQVISRDAEAVKLALRLFSITDGAYSEELDIILGKLIRIDPKLFLNELVENQGTVGNLGGLLGNEGDEYVDRINAQCLENRLRKKALQSVSDRPLLKMRDECIQELDRQWHAYCGANQ